MHHVHVFFQYFYLPNAHNVSLYTFIVLLSYLMVVVYISVSVCILFGRGQNRDEKYDQCILFFPLTLSPTRF